MVPEVSRIEATADEFELLGCVVDVLDRESCTFEVGQLNRQTYLEEVRKRLDLPSL